MSRDLITVPPNAQKPDWNFLGYDPDGLFIFRIQVEPQRVAASRLRNVVLSTGNNFFFLKKAQRAPGKPAQAPLQPYTVWAERITQ